MTTAMWLVLVGCALLGIQALIRGLIAPPRVQSSAAAAASAPTTSAATTASLGRYKPPPEEKEVTNSIGMRLVRIPPGKFLMGSPKSEQGREQGRNADETQHPVEITQAFWMGATEVTQGQYHAVMKTNPSFFQDVAGEDTKRFPVERVSWDDAQKFCQALSALSEEVKHGRKYRLPTEAQWEYACRGGAPSHSIFHYGNRLTSEMANFNGGHPYPDDAKKGPDLARTSAVGSFDANAFGLFDMHGNVVEWCQDYYAHYDPLASKDPSGPKSGGDRVRRGGSWNMGAIGCRTAERNWLAPGERDGTIGFRVVLVP